MIPHNGQVNRLAPPLPTTTEAAGNSYSVSQHSSVQPDNRIYCPHYEVSAGARSVYSMGSWFRQPPGRS